MSHCTEIRYFSTAVFNFLTEIFSYGLSFSELGLTDHLVLHIARVNRIIGLQDVEIYKVGWNIESVYGNDLDLFVQDSFGNYNWYALQAKIMSSNGDYSDLKQKNVPVQQWQKLQTHESTFGSKAFYLLYNGKYSHTLNNITLTRRDCIGIPPLNELGLGIVEVNEISNLRLGMTPAHPINFSQVCPSYMDSIRKLFCCISSLPSTKKQYTRNEIKTDGYQQVLYNDNLVPSSFEVSSLPEGAAPVRMIIKLKESASR
jgi:hypothetical protein